VETSSLASLANIAKLDHPKVKIASLATIARSENCWTVR
jgi:hypothetical protein